MLKEEKNYENVRLNDWRHNNKEKVLAARIRAAFRLLVRFGIIDREKVLKDPTI